MNAGLRWICCVSIYLLTYLQPVLACIFLKVVGVKGHTHIRYILYMPVALYSGEARPSHVWGGSGSSLSSDLSFWNLVSIYIHSKTLGPQLKLQEVMQQ